MFKIIKSYGSRILIPIGIVLIAINYSFELGYMLIDNDVIKVVEIDIDQNDSEDRTDTLEDELEKEKITTDEVPYEYAPTSITATTPDQVLRYFLSIHLEQKTPPPENRWFFTKKLC